ncbi:DUF779 domain-containing protein [Granulicoccus sp. GXG6511]|uniref:DUF779 domain-containing protein n=1 Tax=Granulicoccus sp. GXG6511 TaxID=3381351 RepID=UPI003D7CBA9E
MTEQGTPQQPGWEARALVTVAAAELLRSLHGDHGPLMFHQSGGCCDGSAPMCYPDGDFIIGDRDVLLGRVDVGAGVPPIPVWISGSQYAAWRHTQLIVDVVPGRGAGFSLEAPTGQRFLTRSRVIPGDLLRELPEPLTGAEIEAGAEPPVAYPPVDPTQVADNACAVPGEN